MMSADRGRVGSAAPPFFVVVPLVPAGRAVLGSEVLGLEGLGVDGLGDDGLCAPATAAAAIRASAERVVGNIFIAVLC
ncbi:MAG: hypothetical protein ACRD1U_00905 [Vicinamibacterales bacterium]